MGASEKAAATYHPQQFECPECDRPWGNADAARHCAILDRVEETETRKAYRAR